MLGPEEELTETREEVMEWCFHAWSNDERERRDTGAQPFDSDSFYRVL